MFAYLMYDIPFNPTPSGSLRVLRDGHERVLSEFSADPLIYVQLSGLIKSGPGVLI